MINSNSVNMMKTSCLCLPLQTPLLTLQHATGPCNKVESSAVNDGDVKTSRGQTKEYESREVTQHCQQFIFKQLSLDASAVSGDLQISVKCKVPIILLALPCIAA